MRDANAARDELQGLGLEDGEDDEGGMVTGNSNVEVTGRRHHGRGGKKKGRRERQQENQNQRQAEPEDEDSSDLSDDSDEEGSATHRFVSSLSSMISRVSHTIKIRRSNQILQNAGPPRPS